MNDKPASTKESVIAAARVLFVRFGHAKTSVEEIAREAGLSKATVYNHFDGKEAIVAGVIEFERRAMMKKLLDTVGETSDPLEQLQAFFQTRVREVERHFKAYRAGKDDIIKHMPQVARAIEDSRKEERSIIEGILKKGVKAGIFRPLEDITLTADLLFTTLLGLTFPLFGRPVRRSLDKRAEALAVLFLVGICSDRSRSKNLNKEQT